MLASWKESYDKPRQWVKRQRHHFAEKCPYSQSYGFSSSHIWMWELDHKEGWSEVEVTQLCLTLCNLMDYIVHGILQARILEWVTFPFCRGSSQPRDATQVSCMQADSLPAEPQGKQRRLSANELMLLNCGAGKDSLEFLEHQGDQTSQS